MRLVLAGMSARDAAVFGVFLARDLPAWTWQSAPAGQGSLRPPADILVLDVVALGWLPHSETSLAGLLHFTQGTPAVLLLPAFERSWAALDPQGVASHRLVRLAKPYGTQAMRDALQGAASMVQAATPVSPSTSTPQPQSKMEPQPPAPLPLQPQPEAPSLSAAGLHTRLAAMPPAQGWVFLRQLSSMLQQAQPFEARFTVQNSLIVHPADGWIASNTPLTVIQQVCRSDVLASAVTMRVLDGLQAEERTQRLGMRPSELEAFLWALVSVTSLAAGPTP